MSMRVMVEINLDFPIDDGSDQSLIEWASRFKLALSHRQHFKFPPGVTYFGTRHHSEPCPMGEPPEGWNNTGLIRTPSNTNKRN